MGVDFLAGNDPSRWVVADRGNQRLQMFQVAWKQQPPLRREPALVQLVRSCFRQRRKTLRKILKEWLEADDPWWQEMGVDPATRPDQLSPRQWESLARKIGDSSSLPR
jgi:16S rRNA A1518/A1519 N6-dimethyltransferase RsmA/KsgA/DIM1 with predicted DNA glycosylase/AP lyase activity